MCLEIVKKNYFFTFYFNFLTNNPAFILFLFFNTFNTKITTKKKIINIIKKIYRKLAITHKSIQAQAI